MTRSTTYKTALTNKQESFCIEYIKDYRKEQAAIRAGYSERGASAVFGRISKKPKVIARMAELEAAKYAARVSVSQTDSVVLNDEANQQLIKDIAKHLPNQEGSLLWGVFNNKGILTRSAINKFACTNIPTVARKVNNKIFKYGIELMCQPQKVAHSRMKQHEWYLRRTTKIEYFDTDIVAANDEVLS